VCPLHSENIIGFLYDAQRLIGSGGQRTVLTGIHIRKIVANRTTADGPLYFKNGFRNLTGVGRIHLEDEECQPLCGFCPDTGKLLELIDEAADRFRDVAHR
jgi:hypothetical protein